MGFFFIKQIKSALYCLLPKTIRFIGACTITNGYMYIVLTSIDNRKLTLDYGMVMLHFLIITHFYTVSDTIIVKI